MKEWKVWGNHVVAKMVENMFMDTGEMMGSMFMVSVERGENKNDRKKRN